MLKSSKVVCGINCVCIMITSWHRSRIILTHRHFQVLHGHCFILSLPLPMPWNRLPGIWTGLVAFQPLTVVREMQISGVSWQRNSNWGEHRVLWRGCCRYLSPFMTSSSTVRIAGNREFWPWHKAWWTMNSLRFLFARVKVMLGMQRENVIKDSWPEAMTPSCLEAASRIVCTLILIVSWCELYAVLICWLFRLSHGRRFILWLPLQITWNYFLRRWAGPIVFHVPTAIMKLLMLEMWRVEGEMKW